MKDDMTWPSAPKFNNIKLTYPKAQTVEIVLNRRPVNAINLETWQELTSALSHLEAKHPTCTLILSSSLQVFSAGNDLNELHAPSTTCLRFKSFWITSTKFLSRLYSTPLCTIAAINGYCPAGGLALALCCDMRVASKSAKLGLNESALGISVPRYYAALLLRTANHRAAAESMLLSGAMISATRAQELGLIDYIDMEPRNFALSNAPANSIGRSLTKINIRQQFADDWHDYAEEEANQAWISLSKKETSDALGKVLARLRRPKL